MSVIAFQPKPCHRGDPWSADELSQLVEALAPGHSGSADAGHWAVGVTEVGDPQFYLLGPQPHEECLLSISRLGRVYVLEDGAGKVLLEHNSLAVLAEQARATLARRNGPIVARLALLWCAIRAALEEKLEPIVGESEEILTHFVPQLAALA